MIMDPMIEQIVTDDKELDWYKRIEELFFEYLYFKHPELKGMVLEYLIEYLPNGLNKYGGTYIGDDERFKFVLKYSLKAPVFDDGDQYILVMNIPEEEPKNPGIAKLHISYQLKDSKLIRIIY